MTRKISIDPITRLEGHGKIEIFLDDEGAVEDCFFQIPELRGFERFVVGRPIEELPRLVTRICGVCPAAHHMASASTIPRLVSPEHLCSSTLLPGSHHELQRLPFPIEAGTAVSPCCPRSSRVP